MSVLPPIPALLKKLLHPSEGPSKMRHSSGVTIELWRPPPPYIIVIDILKSNRGKAFIPGIASIASDLCLHNNIGIVLSDRFRWLLRDEIEEIIPSQLRHSLIGRTPSIRWTFDLPKSMTVWSEATRTAAMAALTLSPTRSASPGIPIITPSATDTITSDDLPRLIAILDRQKAFGITHSNRAQDAIHVSAAQTKSESDNA